MDNTKDSSQTTALTDGAQAANTILELESMIKNTISTVDRNKEELKKYKEMIKSALTNDERYREADLKVKELAKEKAKPSSMSCKIKRTEISQKKQKNSHLKSKKLISAFLNTLESISA